MFCPKCGEMLPDNAAFCPACGQSVKQSQPQRATCQPQQNPYSPQNSPYQSQQIPYQPQQIPYQSAQPSMKWFKFLINFSLFASAAINVFIAIGYFIGSGYGGFAEMFYDAYNGLLAWDVFSGILQLAISGLCIYARFQLSGFKRNGPAMLKVCHASVIAFYVIYLIGAACIFGKMLPNFFNFAAFGRNIAINLVMLIVNHIYFKKRAHLFVR